MHESAFEKMRAVRSVYLAQGAGRIIRVLDVGSNIGPGTLGFRSLFPSPDFEYVGLDIVEGYNVDLVPKDPFRWEEIENESFDLVMSSQMLEHNPYFWITVAEMARVAVEGGVVAITSPAAGSMHRHPIDCWRFYPDSWVSMCTYVGLELIEAYREYPSWKKTIPGTSWQDAMMVAQKPHFGDEVSRSDFYQRVDAIVATRTEAPPRLKRPQHVSTRNGETAWRRYEETHVFKPSQIILRRPLHLWQLLLEEITKLKETRVPLAVRHRIWARDGRQALRRGEALMPWDSKAVAARRPSSERAAGPTSAP